MKKKICFTIVIIYIVLSFALCIYVSSIENLENVKNNFDNTVVSSESLTFVNFAEINGVYVSQGCGQIQINDLSCYVNTIRISGSNSITADNIKVYYVLQPGEPFTDVNCVSASYSISGNDIYIKAGVMAADLRIEIAPMYGAEIEINEIEINDKSLRLSIGWLAGICILPSCILGIFLFMLLKYKSAISYFITFKKFVPLLQNLISRDLKVKYRRSILGFLWSVLNPLLMALVINTVFSNLFRFQQEYFAVYYLTGSMIFNFVVECTSNSMMSVISASSLIKKVYIPKYIFPMQKCVFAFINMLFSIVALIVVMLIQGIPFRFSALLFFIPMIYAFVFAYGLSLILAAFTVFFRDIEHLYSVWCTIWMYLTPIIYPEDLLSSSGLRIIMKLNPMYYYVHSFRQIVMYGSFPTLFENVICISFSLVSLICGLTIFKKLQDKFILYI